MADDPTNVASDPTGDADASDKGGNEGVKDEARGDAPSFDTSKLPPALRGKTAEEIATWYEEREGTIKTLATDVDKLKTQIRNRATPAAAPREEAKDPSPEEFFADPVGATNRLIEKRTAVEKAPIEATNIDLIERTAMIEARQKLDDFADFEDAIEEFIAEEEEKKNLRVIRTPETIERIYWITKGRRADADARAKDRAISAEKPSPPKKEDARAKLTDEERSFARRMRLTDEEYLANRDEGEFNVAGKQAAPAEAGRR